jgi:hypothetical protein
VVGGFDVVDRIGNIRFKVAKTGFLGAEESSQGAQTLRNVVCAFELVIDSPRPDN